MHICVSKVDACVISIMSNEMRRERGKRKREEARRIRGWGLKERERFIYIVKRKGFTHPL